jgi:hypothetical protein
MRQYRRRLAIALLTIGVQSHASAQTLESSQQARNPRDAVCQMIDTVARTNGLPVDFFVRLIWRESHLQPDAIGPLTRGGQHAEGIAQFMPGTAVARGLYAPFDPLEALPKSAALLAELRDQFGNLGLAAAAYNAGPQRVRDFLAGLGHLPQETRAYVLAITGRPVEDWAISIKPGNKATPAPPASSASEDCHELIAKLEQTPNAVVTEWRGHKVPGWCRDLHRPNLDVCGPVHALTPTPSIANAVRSPRSRVHFTRTSAR